MNAFRAEWTKLRSDPGVGWLLLAAVLLTVGVGAGISASTSADPCTPRHCQDVVRAGLTGSVVGQAAVVVVAVLAMAGEFGTGMIRTSVAAVPGRGTLFAAKVAVLGLVLGVVGLVGTAGSLLAAWWVLPRNGFTAANGFSSISLADGPTLRAALGSVLYLVLVGWLAVGCATVVRDAAGATGVVLGLLYLFPVLARVVTDPVWQERLQRIAPLTAGQAVLSTVGVSDLPIGPWSGLGVLGAWAAVAMGVGVVLLRRRDV